jgi:hypothetical protein
MAQRGDYVQSVRGYEVWQTTPEGTLLERLVEAGCCVTDAAKRMRAEHKRWPAQHLTLLAVMTDDTSYAVGCITPTGAMTL